MGLDSIEILMDVEDAFGITIENAEAGSISTVGDMFHLVAMKCQVLPGDRCLSARAFHQLRRAILAVHPAAPARLRPSTPIDEALPSEGRRAVWRRLAEATALRLPALHASATTVGWLICGTVVGAVALGVLAGWQTLAAIGVGVGALAFGVLGRMAYMIASRTAGHVPSCRTLGELAHLILCRNFGTIARESGVGYHRELWPLLCRVIGDVLGVDPGELRPEQSFVKDLNVG